jgi:hypothetical protein
MRFSPVVAAVIFAVGCASESSVQAEQSPADQPRETLSRSAAATGAQPVGHAQTSPDKPTRPPDVKADQGTVGTTGVNAEAAVLEDFRKRIDAYVKLHKKAAQEAPKLKETEDPAKIIAAQNGLAAEIQKARATAQPGDIFTPDIRRVFRRILAPELKGEDGRDAKRVLKDDAPASVPLKVNSKYPKGAALPTVPASILLNLPTLPEEVEYRIIDKHLILLDTKADLIVDYIPNAIA